ncbi:PAS domain-containing protein [Bradyrhizobium sp. P5_C11_2]
MFIDEYELSPPGCGWNYEPACAQLFQKISAPLYTTDAEGWLTYYNDAAAELWGRRPAIGEERWCGSWHIYEINGTRLPRERWPLALSLQQGSAVRGLQVVLERPDGTRVPIMPHPTPLRDRSGKIVAGSNILVKVTPLSALRAPFACPQAAAPLEPSKFERTVMIPGCRVQPGSVSNAA